MSNSLRISIIGVAVFLCFIIFTLLKKGRIPLKYALVWLMPTTLLFLLAVVPNRFFQLTKLVGFETTSNMIAGVLFTMLIFVCISLIVIVSGQNTKITLLIQEISLLKEELKKVKMSSKE